MQSNLQIAQPQPISAYRVCVNNRFGPLEANNARIQVSVGNPRYEGEKLKALLSYCRDRFDNTQIILSDTLQRHNKPDPARYWMACRREGKEWIERNRDALKGFQIVRWDEYLMDDRYAAARTTINRLTSRGEGAKALAILVEKHIFKAPLNQCYDFLREELAIFSFMMEVPAVDIYAGSWISPLFRAVKLPVFANIKCLSVDFERKKNFLAA